LLLFLPSLSLVCRVLPYCYLLRLSARLNKVQNMGVVGKTSRDIRSLDYILSELDTKYKLRAVTFRFSKKTYGNWPIIIPAGPHILTGNLITTRSLDL
jgi:hypothetical protein